ncbi:MAG: glycosyltransferase family 4 protein [Chitinophagales bacterium]|nr:glycosyltransferase family 4 protein [Chitinophagales bacterium]
MKAALVHLRFGLKGGLETRLHNYIRYFQNRGDEVQVLTGMVTSGMEVPPGVEVKNLHIKPVPKPLRPIVFAQRAMRYMQQEKYDFSLSLSRTYGQQMVIAANTHRGYLKALGKKFTLPSDWIQLHLDRQSFLKSQLILACSEMVKQEIIQWYHIPGEKIKVLYPPLDTTRFYQRDGIHKAELRQQFGLPQGHQLLVFASTSHNRKGLPLLLEVMKDFKEAPITLAVAGSNDDFGQANVKAVGFVKNMEGLYWAADALVHPAIYEPFGQVISEAVACGIPAIVSSMTGAKEVLDTSTGLVLDNYDKAAWKATIEATLSKEWHIPSDWASAKGLPLEQHMEKMLGYWKKLL